MLTVSKKENGNYSMEAQSSQQVQIDAKWQPYEIVDEMYGVIEQYIEKPIKI